MGRWLTLKVFEDNALVRSLLEEPGAGRVLVIDGGGSMRCALVGGNLAQLGVDNGWHGLIVFGCIRDSEEIRAMPIGVKALATHPRRSEKGLAHRPPGSAGHVRRRDLQERPVAICGCRRHPRLGVPRTPRSPPNRPIRSLALAGRPGRSGASHAARTFVNFTL